MVDALRDMRELLRQQMDDKENLRRHLAQAQARHDLLAQSLRKSQLAVWKQTTRHDVRAHVQMPLTLLQARLVAAALLTVPCYPCMRHASHHRKSAVSTDCW